MPAKAENSAKILKLYMKMKKKPRYHHMRYVYTIKNEPFSYFVSLQSPCSSSPCQHEATCVTNYRDGSFGCRCAKGFIGEYCEKGE